MKKAIKIRIYPSKEQMESLSKQFGGARWVYNHMLNLRMEAWQKEQKSLSKSFLIKLLPILKADEKTSWLKENHSQILQQSVMHLDLAFQRFFRRQGAFPKFKSKHGKQSISYPQGVKIKGKTLYLPKVGNVKAIFHREIWGDIKTVTISKTPTGKYFASILTDNDIEQKQPQKSCNQDKILGIDLGLTDFLVTNTGEKIANPKFLNKALQSIKQKQKALSRKQKGSHNRAKARIALAKAHEKLANVRNDFQHKLSKKLADENQAVMIETLKVKNMMKNRRLSQSIGDASWHSFITKLEYKLKDQGKRLVKLDQWFASSKTCSSCGAKQSEMGLNIRHWHCACGAKHDRDINAAINIKNEGIKALMAEGHPATPACGEHVRPKAVSAIG